MEYRCGYCNKQLKGKDKVYIKEINNDYFIPYCSQEHKNKDTFKDKILIVGQDNG